MQSYRARVREISLDKTGEAQAWIECPTAAVPPAGKYVRARAIASPDAVVAQTLFSAGRRSAGFQAAHVPASWTPGIDLTLTGPLGQGFTLPGAARHILLAVFSPSASRLLPLVDQALASGADVSIFSDTIPTNLPSRVEINPIKLLPENLVWADFIAVDLPLELIDQTGSLLGLKGGQFLPCPGQALIYTAFPCSGQAQCGACAVKLNRGWKFACEDGPVFNLRELIHAKI